MLIYLIYAMAQRMDQNTKNQISEVITMVVGILILKNAATLILADEAVQSLSRAFEQKYTISLFAYTCLCPPRKSTTF